jgi:putative nucleotidyltransferase with HDIG domain
VKIPSEKECYRLIAKMQMFEHIVMHSEQVKNVACFLSDRLLAAEIALNLDLVRAGALLHDITKTRSFRTGENHAETGAELMLSLGYPEVGNVIGQHVKLTSFEPDSFPTEAELVNYADKRVLHDKVVSFDTRMAYILDHYGKTPEHRQRLLSLYEESKYLEGKIFGYLDFKPDQLADCL